MMRELFIASSDNQFNYPMVYTDLDIALKNGYKNIVRVKVEIPVDELDSVSEVVTNQKDV